jgi:23S rRNA pseudouridine1911/1915/1917 synthase
MFEVIYEDNHLLIVNKKSGVLVQGDKTGDLPLLDILKVYIKEKFQKPGEVFLGTVHRLDRPVSGLVVFARTSKALERMNELFKSKNIRKTYWAIVTSKPDHTEAKLIQWLIKDEQKNVTTAYNREVSGSLRAELSYRLIGSSDNQYLLEVNPVTGRPHQIRVQLAGIGCPIKGDLKYGSAKANSDGSICLHARKLEFIHPVRKEPFYCEAPLPETGFWKAFQHFI